MDRALIESLALLLAALTSSCVDSREPAAASPVADPPAQGLRSPAPATSWSAPETSSIDAGTSIPDAESSQTVHVDAGRQIDCSCFAWVHLDDFGKNCDRTRAACEASRARGYPRGHGMTMPCEPAKCAAGSAFPFTAEHGTLRKD